MTALKQIHREVAQLMRSLDSTFDGQAMLSDTPLELQDEEILLKFAIKPTNGLYKDCRIRFEANLTRYPGEAPGISMLDTVAHPNTEFVDVWGQTSLPSDICLSTLTNWKSNDCHQDLTSVLQGVLYIFHHPEPDDALVPVGNMEKLRHIVEKTKRGINQLKEEELFCSVEFSNVYEGPDTLHTLPVQTPEGAEVMIDPCDTASLANSSIPAAAETSRHPVLSADQLQDGTEEQSTITITSNSVPSLAKAHMDMGTDIAVESSNIDTNNNYSLVELNALYTGSRLKQISQKVWSLWQRAQLFFS